MLPRRTPLAPGPGRRHGRAPRVRRPAVRRNSNPSRKGGFGDTQVLCRRSGGTRAGSVGGRRSGARPRRRRDDTRSAARPRRSSTCRRTRSTRSRRRRNAASSTTTSSTPRSGRTSTRSGATRRVRRHRLGVQGERKLAAGRRRRGDAERRRHGALVLAQFGATSGPKTLELDAAADCYRVFAEDDTAPHNRGSAPSCTSATRP